MFKKLSNKWIKFVLVIVKYAVTLLIGAIGGSDFADSAVNALLH